MAWGTRFGQLIDNHKNGMKIRTRSWALRLAGLENDLPHTWHTGRGRLGFPADDFFALGIEILLPLTPLVVC